MKRTLGWMLVFGTVGISTAVHAKTQKFIGVDLNYAHSNNTKIDGITRVNPIPSTLPMHARFGNSPQGKLSVGCRFSGFAGDTTLSHAPRLKLTVHHNQSTTSSVVSETTGHMDAWMLSAGAKIYPLEALEIMQTPRYNPYVSLGMGAARARMNMLTTTFRGFTETQGSFTHPGRNRTRFGWRIGGGLEMPVYGPDWLLNVGYEFQDFGKVEPLAGKYTRTSDNMVQDIGRVQGLDLKLHSFTLGVRYLFF